MEKRPPSRYTITIESNRPTPAVVTRKKKGVLGTLGLAAAVMGASGGTVPNPRPYRSGRRAGLSDAGHVSRATLAGVPGTTRNKLTKKQRKARRNHRRAMRNRMGYR